MQNRLILTLWLVGAVLYAGSTVFLAHAVLGGGSSAPDKAKTATVAAASDAKCQKDSVASADTKPAKPAAEPQKTAAIEPKKPASGPSPAKPAAPRQPPRSILRRIPSSGPPKQMIRPRTSLSLTHPRLIARRRLTACSSKML